MNLIAKLLTAAAFAATMTQPVVAASINASQTQQHNRIAQGLNSGEITRWEAKKLAQEQRRITKMERQFRSDGHLGPVERKILKVQLGKSSQHIYSVKHNFASR